MSNSHPLAHYKEMEESRDAKRSMLQKHWRVRIPPQIAERISAQSHPASNDVPEE